MNWVPAIVWYGLIFYLSHQSLPPGADLAPAFLGHIAVYLALGLLLVFASTSRFRRPLNRRKFLGVIGLILLGGVLDEFHQSFVPGRVPSAWDVAFDMLGGALGAFVGRRLAPRFKSAAQERNS